MELIIDNWITHISHSFFIIYYIQLGIIYHILHIILKYAKIL
jgi:hypothetical protein